MSRSGSQKVEVDMGGNCEKCGGSYSANLLVHHRNHHCGLSGPCPVCKVPQNFYHLTTHMHEHHPIQIGIPPGSGECEYLPKLTGQQLVQHMFTEYGLDVHQNSAAYKGFFTVFNQDRRCYSLNGYVVNPNGVLITEDDPCSEPMEDEPSASGGDCVFKYAYCEEVGGKQLTSSAIKSLNGYVHGHGVPIVNFIGDDAASQETCLFTNIAPQTRFLNGGVMLACEKHERRVARVNGRVIVLVGTIYDDASVPVPVAGGYDLEVPSAFFKVLIIENDGHPPKFLPFLFSNKTNGKELFMNWITLQQLRLKVPAELLPTTADPIYTWAVQEKSYTCIICKQIVPLSEYTSHSSGHTSHLMCSYTACFKVFQSKEELEQHKMTDHPVLTCDQCGYTCSNKSNLASHLLSHQDSKEHRCIHCQKEYKNPKSLNNHIIVHHSELKSVYCGIGDCQEGFARRDKLILHVLNHHSSVRRFRCPLNRCASTYNNRGHLRNHLSRDHKKASKIVDQLTNGKSDVEEAKNVYAEHSMTLQEFLNRGLEKRRQKMQEMGYDEAAAPEAGVQKFNEKKRKADCRKRKASQEAAVASSAPRQPDPESEARDEAGAMQARDPFPSESDSDSDGDSSGGENGKKKSAKGRAKNAAATRKKGAGRDRGRAPAKRRRDESDESEESEGESSDSDFVATAASKKRATAFPTKRRATASPAAVSEDTGRGSRGRASVSKSYKEVSEEDFSEEGVVVKKPAPKAKAPQKPAPKKGKAKEKEESEEDQFSDALSGSEEEAKPKEKKANNSKPKDEAKSEDGNKKATKNGDGEKETNNAKDEDESDNESKKSDVSSKSSKSAGSGKGKDAGENNALKNRTETDYSSINFSCEKKSPSGDAPNFKIASWNIGGIKAFLKKNGLEYIKQESPDVLCLQEIKCNEKTKPEEVQKIDGYPHLYWCFSDQPGMHGVAILSKTEPVSVKNGLPVDDEDEDDVKSSKEKFSKEGRLITAEFEKFYLINAYVPNSGRGEKTEKDPKGYPPKINSGERQKFDQLFKYYIKKLEETKPVIVTGDLNVSHAEIDLANPKTNERTAGFTKEEREGMSKLLEETTLFDAFRKLYPEQKGAYTFWSYMHNARQKNFGWRLDYFLLSEKLRDSLCENVMRTDVYGSDHCPLVLFIKV